MKDRTFLNGMVRHRHFFLTSKKVLQKKFFYFVIIYAKKFMETYDHKIREYGVVQKSHPFLYSNISHHARESHADLCKLIYWVHSNEYVGPNTIGRKYGESLFHQEQISMYFKKEIDTSFDALPDDLKHLIFQMRENSEKMYGHINDLIKIFDSRDTKKFDVKLCLKTLRKISPVVIKLNPDFKEHVKALGGFLKEFDIYYKGEHYWKELPLGNRGDFEYYNHLWYGMTRFEGPDGLPVKLTPELLAHRETIRNIFKNIEIRHEQEDNKPFIDAPYIIDHSKE